MRSRLNVPITATEATTAVQNASEFAPKKLAQLTIRRQVGESTHATDHDGATHSSYLAEMPATDPRSESHARSDWWSSVANYCER